MARRSQCSSAGDNPLDPNYLPPHYREEYRLAIDALIEEDLDGYYQFLQKTDVVDFLSPPEIQYIQECVQVPQHGNLPEQRFLETCGDGSSDTYWPLHSDLEAPGLDLGWPQLHHFIGPTEVTTLVNPAEPDMPSIKEQARRLIKNAQQVIAVAMDIFTDVDIFHDIVTAAMRNVAVYILLDEQNAHLFINMVSNCRVNLQSIQFLRVRTVSGISYHCRSGKSFKGQMMDRFLLTDCRAVLSGNYSFMWSFEKLHRCMAHLFLGQLVSTFDEEFRILYAQSQPLVVENMLAPMEDFSLLQKRQFPSDLTSLYREPRKFQPGDMVQSEEWARHSHDERMDLDWRMMPFKRRDSLHGPADMYGRFPLQQSRMDPSFDQSPSRMAVMENPAFKRHSYAEGGHGRYSLPFLPQQGTPEPENQGRQFQSRQQPYPGPGKETESSVYDKFWNQDYHVADQYSEPGLPQEIEPSDNFDPVLNYLSSTRNVDFDQSSDKLPQAADLPLSSSFPRRTSLGQIYACQTSPTPPNSTEQKQFFPEPNTDRKDPIVKRGLRDWRISSYLSAYDSKGDDGLPLAAPNAPDLVEEPTNLLQQTTLGKDYSVPKIPNVREFKVPVVPRASQIPSYAKITTREQPKKLPDEATTPTPSDSSSTTEGEKTEEVEQKEPKTVGLHREESFRRKYNPTVPRSSRLRSSLIFSSLEHQHTQDTKTPQGQQDEESDKNEAEQTKQPFVSQVLGQRRSAAREPFEWSRYMKSATFDSSATDSSKPDDETSKDVEDSSKDTNTKDPSGKGDVQESLKPPYVDQANTSPSMPRSKPSEAELPKTDQADQPVQLPKPLLNSPLYVDMSDPDTRLMFFKELAAKRKAAKATEAEKSKEKVLMKPSNAPTKMTTGKKEEVVPPTSEGLSEKNATTKDVGKDVSVSLSVEATDKTNKDGSQVKDDPNSTQSCKQAQTRLSTDSDVLELKNVQLQATLSVSVETKAPQSELPQEPKISSAVEKISTSQPPTPTNATPAAIASLAQGTDENKNLDSTSTESSSLAPISVDVTPSSACAALDSSSQNAESAQLEISVSSPPLLSEQPTRSQCGYSIPSDHIVPDSGSQVRPSPSSSTSLSTLEGSSSAIISCTLPTNAQLTAESVEETSQKPRSSSISQIDSESTQDHLDSAHTSAPGSEPKASSLQSSTKTNSEEFGVSTPSEKDVPQSENDSVLQIVEEETDVFGSSTDVKADSLNPSSTESCVPNVAELESKDPTSEHSPVETSSPVHTDSTVQSETASSQGAPTQGSPPPELDPIRPVTPSPAETVSCSSPRAESVETVLPPEAEKTFPALQSSSNASSLSEQITTVSNETPLLPPTKTCSPTEPTSNVPTEPDLPCKTSESVISETSEPPVPTGSSTMDSLIEVTQEPEMPDAGEEKGDDTEATNKVNDTTTTQPESTGCEKTDHQVRKNSCSELPETTSDEVVPSSPQSSQKEQQPKTSQSRYHSSTANVLSSSNLRDDTKLLLEQISANSQSRNESTKESPVTDDEKEDEADKNAQRQKERGIRSFSRGQPKSEQDREKLLERIQSMRKERKVYSRFEMAP